MNRIFIFIIIMSTFILAQDIQLPKPLIDGDLKLADAFKNRKTIREFLDKDLSLQEISNILWCANGINREGTNKKTVPTTQGKNEIDVYVFIRTGVYIYLPEQNILKQIFNEDLRSITGKQDFVKNSPLTLIYIADLSKLGKDNSQTIISASLDTGFIGQSVYLYCAAKGLATGVRAYIDKDLIKEKLKLNENKAVILAQSISEFKSN